MGGVGIDWGGEGGGALTLWGGSDGNWGWAAQLRKLQLSYLDQR